jgi:hypothetical protein
MKRQATMQAHQLVTFARFLEEHPGFSPLLLGEDALVCGFQAGGSFLRIEDMERLIATQPQLDAREAALLLSASRSTSKRRNAMKAQPTPTNTLAPGPFHTRTLPSGEDRLEAEAPREVENKISRRVENQVSRKAKAEGDECLRRRARRNRVRRRAPSLPPGCVLAVRYVSR